MDLVTIIILATGGATVPLLFDMLRTFLPQQLRCGRLVAAWHRQILLSLVVGLCCVAYHVFWESVLPYSHAHASAAGMLHVLLVTWLWVNTVWNFAMCCAVDPGTVAHTEPEPEAGGKGRWPAGSHLCHVCGVRVLQFDHHCPFTGGCVGLKNLRFFLLFALHGWAGMAYACALAWPPFRDCVWRQLELPALGWARVPPPDEPAVCGSGASTLALLTLTPPDLPPRTSLLMVAAVPAPRDALAAAAARRGALRRPRPAGGAACLARPQRRQHAAYAPLLGLEPQAGSPPRPPRSICGSRSRATRDRARAPLAHAGPRLRARAPPPPRRGCAS